MTHNTFLQSVTGRTPITLEDPANGDRNGVRVTFTHNVMGQTVSEGHRFFPCNYLVPLHFVRIRLTTFDLLSPPEHLHGQKVNEGSIVSLALPPAVGTGDGNGTIVAFDHNVYMNLDGGTPGIGTVNRQTLVEWHAASGLDAHSGDGDLSGVTIPDATTWADPRTWGDTRGSALNTAFAAHFTPSHFEGEFLFFSFLFALTIKLSQCHCESFGSQWNVHESLPLRTVPYFQYFVLFC